MLKKLNYQHLLLVIALPIVLILINPNWIFSSNIADDYIYLGYQMNLPKYFGWEPSVNMYFIERMSWILPGYGIRQIFSPLMANFIIHLGVYYIAAFSVYGTLNKLFNSKVAIIITLLFGQYPLMLRAVGWDYMDGYGMALTALAIFWLTQSIGAKRAYLYMLGAGCLFALVVNSNLFNAYYAPSLAVYYMLLLNWRNKPIKSLIINGFFAVLGAILTTGLLAGIYYALTQEILYANAIRISSQTRLVSQWAFYFLQTYAKATQPHWNFLFVAVSLLIIFRPLSWNKASRTPSENPNFRNYRVILRAVVGLFAITYLVIGVYQFQGYVFARLSFYNAPLVLTSFLLLGAILAPRLSDSKQRASKYAPLIAFFVPMIPLALFTLSPETFHLTNRYVSYAGAIICIILAFFPRMAILGVAGFALFAGVMLNDSRPYAVWPIYPAHLDIYVADRYMTQDMYEDTIEISEIISQRYSDFSLDKFRLFYDKGRDPHTRLFNAVSGIYLWSWDRVLEPSNIQDKIEGTEDEEAQIVNELILLSSVDRTDALIDKLSGLVNVTEIERHRFTNSRGDIDLIFFRVTPNSVP
jgi:hypothetical protein